MDEGVSFWYTFCMKKESGKKFSRTNTKDRFAVVLEKIDSDIQIFGEKLDFLEEKFGGEFESAQQKLDRIERELILIKSDIGDLKDSLGDKADLKRLLDIEKRVGRLEAVLLKRS